ncbi:MAG: DUF6599 family protein [Sedimentisphaerales bacterium]|jgi:hypothetical protein
MSFRHVRKLESAIGIVFLFHLVLIVAVLLVIQSRYDMARFGLSATANGQNHAQPAGLPQTEKSALSLSSFATTDLPAVGNAEVYNTDNLYEKIDGKAPMYQEAGFQNLITQRFASKSNSELGLELFQYDMGNAKNAFSVYSRQKRPDVTDLNGLGSSAFGYVAGNAICISLGKNYIEMIGSSESNELVGGMKDMAKNLVAKLPPSEKDKIAELGYFPTEGTVAGSWKLQIDNAFGFDGLTDTYSAQYKSGEKTVSIFLSKRKNEDEAKTVAKNYYDFLITNGAKASSIDSEILKSAGASVLDFYGSIEIVFPAGVFVGGIHEADNKQAAEKAAEVLIDRLKKI